MFFKKLFGVKNKKPVDYPIPDEEIENPTLIIQLVDDKNLDVAIAWPKNCDITAFAQVLQMFVSGNIADSLTVAAAVYGESVNQFDKAMIIHSAINKVAQKKNPDRPLVLPSKVISNQIKINGN